MIRTYTNKQANFEVIQYNERNFCEVSDFLISGCHREPIKIFRNMFGLWATLDGKTRYIYDGDYVARDEQGEITIYPKRTFETFFEYVGIKHTISQGFKDFYEKETGEKLENSALFKGETVNVGGLKITLE